MTKVVEKGATNPTQEAVNAAVARLADKPAIEQLSGDQPINPSVSSEKAVEDRMARRRRHSTLPRQQLEAPEIPGYVCHWFNDTGGRIAWALEVGYEFVRKDESDLNGRAIGTSVEAASKGSDLGSRVSIHGGTDEHGQSVRMVLMKIKREFWEEDQGLLEAKNRQIAETIKRGTVRAGEGGETSADVKNRYVRADISTSNRRV